MNIDVERIKEATRKWDDTRNEASGFNHIRNIRGFSITRAQYEAWAPDLLGVEHFYLYIGLDNEKINFYLCSELLTSIHEGDEKKVIVCSLYKDAPIPSGEAEQRIKRWPKQNEDWFNRRKATQEVVRYFYGPMEDLSDLFGLYGAQEVVFYLAITKDEPQGHAELILTNLDNAANVYYDVTKPRPPF